MALRVELRRALTQDGVRQMGRFTVRYPRAIVEWPIGRVDPFFNVNTPEDLAEADRLATEQSG